MTVYEALLRINEIANDPDNLSWSAPWLTLHDAIVRIAEVLRLTEKED